MKTIVAGDPDKTKDKLKERAKMHPINVVGRNLRCYTCNYVGEIEEQDVKWSGFRPPRVSVSRYIGLSDITPKTYAKASCPHCGSNNLYGFFEE